ncbi:hypothetical protein AGDE_02480 [Angomonas deanei]|nr:hypothetical protein AGDE_11722 [Angomonas deanei]EPY41444.1 hypothetical protein AGDE_02480 [Angomonas deanei]|eukprot:EPY25485.1 hypothetical protein AGDE_11722 [Angomonas deanei]
MQKASYSRRLLGVGLLLLLQLSGCLSAASRESILSCTPTELEPEVPSECIIYVRDGQQEPSMSFSPEDFTVSVVSSSGRVTVQKSALRRGADITTLVFDITSSGGSILTVNVFYRPTVQNGNYPAGPIRKSGQTLTVLSRPATVIGHITCSLEEDKGLTLRQSTICEAQLSDADGQPSVVHADDIILDEINQLGLFEFISGYRILRFRFTALSSPSLIVTHFTIRASIRLNEASQSITFPLKYPDLPPTAMFSSLHCDDQLRPIRCTVYAADSEGPVVFRPADFQVSVWRWIKDIDVILENDEQNGSPSPGDASDDEWYTNTEEFLVSVSANASAIVPITRRADVGLVTASKRINDAIQLQRLSVSVNSNGVSTPIAASPFYFHSGVVPNAAAASLRGCNAPVLGSGNTTTCFIDLLSGISGDIRYFQLTSSLGAILHKPEYVEYDEACRCRTIRFNYTAPTVVKRNDDFIYVVVINDAGQQIINSPTRVNVFPVYDTADPGSDNLTTDTFMIIIGTLFYGTILGIGVYLVIKRAQKGRRVHKQRIARKMQEVRERRDSADVDASNEVAIGGSRQSSEILPRQTSTTKQGFISNAAVDQERYHSDDSD